MEELDILGDSKLQGSKFQGLKYCAQSSGLTHIYSCDDRPSGIIATANLGKYGKAFGIIPPQALDPVQWSAGLLEAGARQVFNNVNDYCIFLLNELS